MIIANIAPLNVSIAPHDIPVGVGLPGDPAGASELALQLALLLTLGSALEVAVTVMVLEAPAPAQLGTLTIRVTSLEAPASRVSEFCEMLGDHPVPPCTLRSKVSVASPVFMTVTL